MVYLAGVYIDPRDNTWKAWYVTLYPPAYPEITYAVCMITSPDGLCWTRPELDVYRCHGGERTNIILDLGKVGGTGAPTIFYEPDREPTPWTMLLSSCGHNGDEYKEYILRSADGIHWRWTHPMPDGTPHGMGDRCTALRGPDPVYRYVLMSRGLSDSKAWWGIRIVLRLLLNEKDIEGETTRVVHPDLDDDPSGQIYHPHAFPHESMYIGLFQWYWETNDPWADMELMTSRDTVLWRRVHQRTAFLPGSPGGGALAAFDCKRVDTALSAPVGTAWAEGRPASGWKPCGSTTGARRRCIAMST